MKLYKAICNAVRELGSYHISTYAASASFFAFTSLFPLLMLALSILSRTSFGTSAFLEGAAMILPVAVREFFEPLILELQESGVTEVSLSLLMIVWTAAKGMMGLLEGLNSIAGVEDKRNFLLKRFMCVLFMMLLTISLLATLGLRVFGSAILSFLQRYLPYVGHLFASLMEFRGFTLFLALALTLSLIYCFFPHKRMRFVSQIPGALFASAAWLIFSEAYSFYVEHASSFSILYGSLGMVVIAMLWIYFCMYIIFIGAVINRY